MKHACHRLAVVLAFVIACVPPLPYAVARSVPQQPTPSPAPAGRVMGTITAITGNILTIKPDTGAETKVTLGDSTRMMRTVPGEKSLSGATPIKVDDLAVGDRVLVRAAPGSDATLLIAMKQADIAQRQQQQREDWQRRGISGLVKSVDPATGTIAINAAAGPTPRPVTVKTTASTVVRQYAPESVKYDDAKLSSVGQIKPGDQLRARGDRSGDTLQAEEIVFGSFLNIAGTVLGTDPQAQTLTVNDFASKKPVTIHVNADSQLHQLPPQMAQMIAMRMRPSANGGAAAAQQGHGPQQKTAASETGEHPRQGLAQMLQQAPATTLFDLHKGEAVMVVASNGNPNEVTAITLLSGVEPLLQASPGASESVFSASWSLGGGQEAANAQAPQ